jgi:hypothetical protein
LLLIAKQILFSFDFEISKYYIKCNIIYNHDDLDYVGGEKGKKLKALHNNHVNLIRTKKELPILFR